MYNNPLKLNNKSSQYKFYYLKTTFTKISVLKSLTIKYLQEFQNRLKSEKRQ